MPEEHAPTASVAIATLTALVDQGATTARDWSIIGPQPAAQGVETTYVRRMDGWEARVRRLRTASGSAPSSDYLYYLYVKRGSETVDYQRSDDATSDLARLVDKVEEICTRITPIVNNDEFTNHVIATLADRLRSGEIDATDWMVEGPVRTNGVTEMWFTTTMGATDITLTRRWPSAQLVDSRLHLYSITVRREDTTIGLLGNGVAEGPLARVVNQVEQMASARVADLQRLARIDLSV